MNTTTAPQTPSFPRHASAVAGRKHSVYEVIRYQGELLCNTCTQPVKAFGETYNGSISAIDCRSCGHTMNDHIESKFGGEAFVTVMFCPKD